MKKITFYLVVLLWNGTTLFAQNESILSNINTEYVEFSPTLSGDGKTMVFQSNREGGFKLFESTLNSEGVWSSPIPIENINRFGKPNFLIGGPCLSSDAKTLYFCAMQQGSGTDMDIYVSKKTNKNEWGSPQSIGRTINTNDGETFPSISPDGKKLFYVSTSIKDNDSKCTKIMMSELDDKNNWQKPIEVVSPMNTTCDKSPRIAYDNKTLFFSTNKNGNYDFYKVELIAPNTWGTPIALDYVNSQESELYASLTPMEDFLYYSKKGNIDIASIPDNHKLHGIGITGKITDIETGKALSGKIFLIDTIAKDTLKKLVVNGDYKLFIPAGKKYKLTATSSSYYNYTINYEGLLNENYKTIDAPIKMKFKKKEVVFNIADKDNNKGLKVKIKVTNLDTKEETLLEANAGRDGKYTVSLKEGNKYNVEISSIEGYAFSNTIIEVPLTLDSEETIYTTTKDSSSSSSNELPKFDIKMEPLKDNTKLTLNDIFFLYNKFELEAESYNELDKVVSLMKANPSAKIEISAHTDDIGSDDFNNNLSTKRAQEIVKYLSSKGISANRMKPKGYGKTRPIDTADSDEARAKNRRVELKILDIK